MIGSIVGGVFMALPGITFFGAVAVIPLLLYVWLAASTNFLPFLILVLMVIDQDSTRQLAKALTAKWVYCTILWIGCAFGISRWGDIASSMGAFNKPFLEVFLMPWTFLKELALGGNNL